MTAIAMPSLCDGSTKMSAPAHRRCAAALSIQPGIDHPIADAHPIDFGTVLRDRAVAGDHRAPRQRRHLRTGERANQFRHTLARAELPEKHDGRRSILRLRSAARGRARSFRGPSVAPTSTPSRSVAVSRSPRPSTITRSARWNILAHQRLLPSGPSREIGRVARSRADAARACSRMRARRRRAGPCGRCCHGRRRVCDGCTRATSMRSLAIAARLAISQPGERNSDHRGPRVSDTACRDPSCAAASTM